MHRYVFPSGTGHAMLPTNATCSSAYVHAGAYEPYMQPKTPLTK